MQTLDKTQQLSYVWVIAWHLGNPIHLDKEDAKTDSTPDFDFYCRFFK